MQSEFTPELHRWIFKLTAPATCRFSTGRPFDHHGKGSSKKVSKKWEKKSNLFVSLIDLIVMKTLFTARLPVNVSSVQTWF